MNYPVVEFVTNNLLEEAKYICFLAKGISRGTYQKENFFVLPYCEKENNLAIYFPDLEYSSKFWKLIQSSPHQNLGDTFPKECIDEVISKLKLSKITEQLKIISKWRKKEKMFFAIIDDLFVNKLEKIKSIKILLTNYGTLGSYIVNGNKFFGTQRSDVSIDDIGRKIIYCLIKFSNKKSAEIGDYEWHARKEIVKHLIENTKLNNLISEARYARPRKKEAQLILDSNNYLTKLGYLNREKLIRVSGWGNITLKGIDINKLFTKNEIYIFKKLLKSKGEIVGFDEFENIPSQYALSKTIENIRKKMIDMGIHSNLLTTVRGKGYLIN